MLLDVVMELEKIKFKNAITILGKKSSSPILCNPYKLLSIILISKCIHL